MTELMEARSVVRDSITDHEINIFISHKEEDKHLAYSLQSILESKSERIRCYITGDDYTKDYRQRILSNLKKSHLLVLLFTSPNKNWDWPLYEAGLYSNLDPKQPNKPVVVIYSSDSPPDPLANIHGVHAAPLDIENFLSQLFTTQKILNVESVLLKKSKQGSLKKDAERFYKQFNSVCFTRSDTSAKLILRSPAMIQIKPEKERRDSPKSTESKDEVVLKSNCTGIPEHFVVEKNETSTIALSYFKLVSPQTWGSIKKNLETDENNEAKDTEWLAELDHLYCLAGSGGILEPTKSTFRSPESAKIYRFMILFVEKSKNRVERICIAMVPELAPEKFGTTLFNLIRFGTRFKCEILDEYNPKIENLGENDDHKPVFKALLGAIDLIEKEAEATGLMDIPKVLEVFSTKKEKQEIQDTYSKWGKLREKLDTAVKDQNSIVATKNALAEIEKLHFKFMEIAIDAYYKENRKQIQTSKMKLFLAFSVLVVIGTVLVIRFY